MIAHNCPRCHYVACKGECGCRCMPLCSMDQAETRLHPTLPIADRFITPESYIAEWEGLIKVEQAERRDPVTFPEFVDHMEQRAKRVPDSYMDGYLRGCSLVHNLLRRTGWAGAKGQIKRIIRVYALDVLPKHYTNWDRGRIDAILDSVN